MRLRDLKPTLRDGVLCFDCPLGHAAHRLMFHIQRWSPTGVFPDSLLSESVPAPAPPLDGTEPTIYVGEGLARADGSPVLGNFGRRIVTFVIMDVATWKRLCAENPGLQTTRFRVGAL